MLDKLTIQCPGKKMNKQLNPKKMKSNLPFILTCCANTSWNVHNSNGTFSSVGMLATRTTGTETFYPKIRVFYLVSARGIAKNRDYSNSSKGSVPPLPTVKWRNSH